MASFISLSKSSKSSQELQCQHFETELVCLLLEPRLNFILRALIFFYSNFDFPELGMRLIHGCSLYTSIYGTYLICN